MEEEGARRDGLRGLEAERRREDSMGCGWRCRPEEDGGDVEGVLGGD
jgi:hypothetical protein